MNTGVITLLKDFFFEIQPHINGHKTAMGKFFKALEILESKPQSEPLPDSNFEQDFKELNRYLDILCQRGHNVKDSGHLWIEFTDKFNAFKKRVLAAASTVSEATTDEDTIGFAEWVVSDNNPAPNKYNSDDDNNGKWHDSFSEGINRHYYTTEQLYQLYRKQSKQ